MSSDNSDSIQDRNPYSDLTDCDTNNATRIGWEDWDDESSWLADHLPEKKRPYYRHLDRHNSGLQNGHVYQNKSFETYQMNRHLILCMSDPLRLGTWERKRAIELFDGLQRSSTGYPSHVVALCTCAYLLHNCTDRKCHPQVNPEDRDPFFEEGIELFDVPQEWYESVYGQIAYRIRNNKIEIQRHDDYEANQSGGETWRASDPGDNNWL